MALEAVFQFIPTSSLSLGGKITGFPGSGSLPPITITETQTTEALQPLLSGAAGALTRKHSLFALADKRIFMVPEFCFLN